MKEPISGAVVGSTTRARNGEAFSVGPLLVTSTEATASIGPDGLIRVTTGLIGRSGLVVSRSTLMGTSRTRTIAGVVSGVGSVLTAGVTFGASDAVRMPVRGSTARRARELKWRRMNTPLLRARYPRQWVALEGEAVVSHGESPALVVAEARRQGVSTPYVFFVEIEDPGRAQIGL